MTSTPQTNLLMPRTEELRNRCRSLEPHIAHAEIVASHLALETELHAQTNRADNRQELLNIEREKLTAAHRELKSAYDLMNTGTNELQAAQTCIAQMREHFAGIKEYAPEDSYLVEDCDAALTLVPATCGDRIKELEAEIEASDRECDQRAERIAALEDELIAMTNDRDGVMAINEIHRKRITSLEALKESASRIVMEYQGHVDAVVALAKQHGCDCGSFQDRLAHLADRLREKLELDRFDVINTLRAELALTEQRYAAFQLHTQGVVAENAKLDAGWTDCQKSLNVEHTGKIIAQMEVVTLRAENAKLRKIVDEMPERLAEIRAALSEKETT